MRACVSTMLVLMLHNFVHAPFPKARSFEINTMCNKTMDVLEATLLSVTKRKDSQQPNLTCIIRLQTKPRHRMKMSFQFASTLVLGLKCVNDTVQIYVDDSYIGLSSKEGYSCDIITTDYVMVSTAELTSIYFYSNNVKQNKDERFEVIILPFHTGTCSIDEYLCNNGSCVDRTIFSDSTYTMCDDEDCSQRHSLWKGIFVMSLLMVFAVVAFYCCWCVRKRRERERDRRLEHSRAEWSPETTGIFDVSAESAFTSMITVPPYDPLSDPPPYSFLPIQLSTVDNVQNTHGDHLRKGEVTPYWNKDPPPYEE